MSASGTGARAGRRLVRLQFTVLFYFWRTVYRTCDWLQRYTKPCPCTECTHRRRVYSRGLS